MPPKKRKSTESNEISLNHIIEVSQISKEVLRYNICNEFKCYFCIVIVSVCDIKYNYLGGGIDEKNSKSQRGGRPAEG